MNPVIPILSAISVVITLTVLVLAFASMVINLKYERGEARTKKIKIVAILIIIMSSVGFINHVALAVIGTNPVMWAVNATFDILVIALWINLIHILNKQSK